ncbi:Hpt domain-containing protein [Reichenbachiella sp. MALMAid0571]|uniref:Hpt domain-containing protein n=1 Tax=Reichenbachiella sp. MALMAid0571 TaxID=3143939 RepID=UPI0032E03D9F
MEQPNLSNIQSIARGSKDFELKLLNVVKEELPTEIDAFEKYIKEGVYDKASEMVHKIKHKISLLSMEQSYYTAEEFENELRNNNPNLLMDFEEILKKMRIFLQRY